MDQTTIAGSGVSISGDKLDDQADHYQIYEKFLTVPAARQSGPALSGKDFAAIDAMPKFNTGAYDMDYFIPDMGLKQRIGTTDATRESQFWGFMNPQDAWDAEWAQTDGTAASDAMAPVKGATFPFRGECAGAHGSLEHSGTTLGHLAETLGFAPTDLRQVVSAAKDNPMHRVNLGGTHVFVHDNDEYAPRHDPNAKVRAQVTLNASAAK